MLSIETPSWLRDDLNVRYAAKKLNISVAAAVGHLIFLWLRAYEFTDEGELYCFEDWEIADMAGFDDERATEFREALVEAGYLEETEEGLIICNWKFVDSCIREM